MRRACYCGGLLRRVVAASLRAWLRSNAACCSLLQLVVSHPCCSLSQAVAGCYGPLHAVAACLQLIASCGACCISVHLVAARCSTCCSMLRGSAARCGSLRPGSLTAAGHSRVIENRSRGVPSGAGGAGLNKGERESIRRASRSLNRSRGVPSGAGGAAFTRRLLQR